MNTKFTGGGISEDIVENFKEYEEAITSLCCCICLDIVKSPFECGDCESLYCEDCWDHMKIAGKKCVISSCKAEVKKANKFVFQMLEKLKLCCKTCGKGGIEYSMYIKHEEACLINKKLSSIGELSLALKEKEMKLLELTTELENMKINGQKAKNSKGDNLTKEQIRQLLITYNLNVTQKMQLYTYAIEGKLHEFKDLIVNKKYPILEEVSAHEFYWTPLHYAMHYGQAEIVYYILNYLSSGSNSLDLVMRLQSNDNRCPLLCLLRSNTLPLEKKKIIMGEILKRYKFHISPEVKNEMRNRDMEELLKKYDR